MGHEDVTTRSRARRCGRRFVAGRTTAALLCAVILGVAITACGATRSGNDAETLVIGIGTEALPNPALATTKAAWTAISYNLVYAPLIRQAADGSLHPGLAVSWEYVDGSGAPNSVFRLRLRTGATFADGSDVTPEAVVTWLRYFVGQTGPLAGVLGEAPTFDAVGPDIVGIRMTSPNPSLPQILSDAGGHIGNVVSPTGVDDPDSLVTNAHGAGPYVLDSSASVRGDHYVYTPNPRYYDPPAIRFRRVVVKLIPDPSTRLAAQQTGQVDVAIGDGTTVEPARRAGLRVLTTPRGVIEIVLDSKGGLAPELRDRRVRVAINHAIDRKSIATALLGPSGVPASAFVPTDVAFGMDDYWTYDPARARSLLAEAGVPDGFRMRALVQGAYFGPLGEPLVRAVAQNLAEVGIELDVVAYATDPEYANEVFGDKAPIFALTGLATDTPTLYNTYLVDAAAMNFFETDDVIIREFQAGARSPDPAPSWTRMWRHFTSQAYVAPVLVNPILYYVSGDIAGVEATDKRPVALPTEWSAT